jgi:hypothetical protein
VAVVLAAKEIGEALKKIWEKFEGMSRPKREVLKMYSGLLHHYTMLQRKWSRHIRIIRCYHDSRCWHIRYPFVMSPRATCGFAFGEVKSTHGNSIND